MISNNRKLVLAVMSYFLYKNLKLQYREDPPEMGILPSYLHTLLFILRTIPVVMTQRLLGWNPNPTTTKWNPFEEIVLRAFSFHANVGNVSVPNHFIK
jgi:hypothetical protein